MKTAVFSAHQFERDYLVAANAGRHELVFLDARLSEDTCPLAAGCQAVSLFVTDKAGATVLPRLREMGVEFIALRSAGFNHVDYVAIRDAQTLDHIAVLERPARILAAVKIGKTRLIDNMAV